MAQLANGAAGIAGSLQKQIRQDVRARIDEIATKMDLIPREDFERLEARLDSLQREQESLRNRLQALEGKKK